MIVKSNERIAEQIYELVLEGKQVESMQPGQFLHLKMKDPSLILRRPISIASVEKDSCHLIYKVVGAGTQDMTQFREGDRIDVLGPLGNGFPMDFIERDDNVLIVGGGIGIAPLYELGKRLKANGATLTFVLGYATYNDIYYKNKFEALGLVVLCTNDGSVGIKGHVGQGIDSLGSLKPKAVYACGPVLLNMFVQTRFNEEEHVYLSLEERMACGVGACHGCDTKRKDKTVCADGPVFHRSEVDL